MLAADVHRCRDAIAARVAVIHNSLALLLAPEARQPPKRRRCARAKLYRKMSWPYAAGAYAAYYGAPAAPPPPPAPKTWKEYKTPEGKPYWSDGATSVWEEPAAYKEAREKAAALIEANKRAKEAPPVVAKDPEPEPNIKPLPVLDPKQKVEAFKQLLSDSDIKSTATFPEVSAKLGQHPTYTALPKGERKQALAEYKTKRAKVEKETERKRSREARAGFLRLLAEAEEISVDTNWSKADELLAATCDERYQAVSTSTERKGLFDEFVSALREKDASEKRQTTEKAREAFRKALVQLAREHPAASHEDDDAALLIGVFGRTRFSDVESAMQKKNPNLLLSLPVWKPTGVASMAWGSTRRFSTQTVADSPRVKAP